MNLTLSTQYKVPVLGLGTWKSKPDETRAAVEAALDSGYRHFDCAFIYGNEPEIGQAFVNKLKSNQVKREELFITSKLWNTFHRPDLVRTACEASLKNLRLSYLDLYLMHWPTAYKEDTGTLVPKHEDGIHTLPSDVDFVDTWMEMEKLLEAGLVRSIGVCNFNMSQLQRLLAACRIQPSMCQFEVHPYFPNFKMVDFCQSNGIQVTGFSPLGSPDSHLGKPSDPVLLKDPIVVAMATKYGKNPGQLLIRYVIQRGCCVIPKSVTPHRIKTNTEVFDFEISEEDMKILNSFNRNFRYCDPPSMKNNKEYPFKEDQ